MALLGTLVVLVMFTPLTYWWATSLAGPWNDPTGDVLIVLAGSTLDTGVIGTSSYWRSVMASQVYRQEHFQEILISGQPGPPMRDFLLSQKVPAEVIQMEPDSSTTRESALFVARLIERFPERYKGRRLVLLTSDYHMLRASRAFRKAGLDILPRPIPDVGKRYSFWWERWGAFLDLFAETGKLGYYWVRGWI